jgi:predicted transcriptional regulator
MINSGEFKRGVQACLSNLKRKNLIEEGSANISVSGEAGRFVRDTKHKYRIFLITKKGINAVEKLKERGRDNLSRRRYRNEILEERFRTILIFLNAQDHTLSRTEIENSLDIKSKFMPYALLELENENLIEKTKDYTRPQNILVYRITSEGKKEVEDYQKDQNKD